MKRDLYVDEIAEEQGWLFKMVVDNSYDLVEFITDFFNTKFKQDVDNRCAWPATRSSDDLYEIFNTIMKKSNKQYDPILAQWIGEFLAYLQSYKKCSSKEIIKKLSPDKIYKMSHALHDYDMELAVRKVGKTI